MTLLEIVVATGIVAILLGILFVVGTPVRTRARQLSCGNNLRQIYQALLLYRADYGGIDDLSGQPLNYWQLGLPPLFRTRAVMAPYLKSNEVWKCPNDWKPVDKYPKSYSSRWPPSEVFPNGARFSSIVAKCQDRLPLMSCRFHGYLQGTDHYFMILRWNGEVKGQHVHYPISWCMD